MTRILIVEDDLDLQRVLIRDLGQRGFDIEAADNVREAIQCMQRSDIDVLLADLRIQDGDGLELLRTATRISARIRPILMSAFASAKDHETATQLGAVRVLSKPFGMDELLTAVRQAVEAEQGFRGSIHGLSLVDLLQMYHFGRRSVEIRLGGAEPGTIAMSHGEIVHAVCGTQQGEAALRMLLAAESGSIQTDPLPENIPRTIERDFDSALLDAMRSLDELQAEAEDDSWIDRLTFSPPPRGSEQPAERSPSDDPQSEEEDGEMGKIDDACQNVVEKVDGAIAAGVVDLDSGMLLGIHNSAGYTQTLNEVVAAATMDLFRGPNVGRVEQMVRSHRGVEENGEHYFDEIHITSKHNFHFAKVLRGGKAVIMLVTKKTTNIGMGWAMLKSVIPDVEPHLP